MTTASNQIKTQPAVHFLAILSLILSILGMLPVLPFIGSIAGIVTGIIARKEIHSQPDLYSGDGTAKAGIILGWIGIGLVLIAVCGLALFLAPVRSISSGPTIITTLQPVITLQP